MQLTRLEIKGFKSFGDKIVVNFDKGITGIVGPNGCGKSNIVDAIRWVLGEQKTSALRSEKMENIIFNGTKTRKPTQMAEVSLSFNNTKNLLPVEYNQVTITRRFYRSGDSEYLLNGVTCRLKDITSLFLDTGIASNSYAIIELKMVDDLLNDKDNSRRQLFEEAAGISKFKIRKKETLKRLSETDADLERVEDLLFEIEKNMKSLERQAKQAENYFKIKEEYKNLSVELARRNLSGYKEKLDHLNKKVEAESDAKLNINKLLAENEARLEKAKTDLLTKEKLLATRQKALNEHVSKIRQYENEKKIKNERLKFLQTKSDTLNEQIEQDKQSKERAAFSLKGLAQELESARKMFAETELNLERLRQERDEQKLKTANLQHELNGLEQDFKADNDDLYQLRKDVEIKQMQLNTFRQELERATSETTEKTASLEEFENKIKQLDEEIKAKNGHLEQLRAQEERLETRIENTRSTIEKIRDEKVQNNRRLDARTNEYNLTKSLVDNLEGFPEAIKFLKKSNWNKNAPLLSEIISCEEKYRVTIENYLEPWMNYYVVDTEAEAYKAINLLSDASKGKAHFFILDRFLNYQPKALKIFDKATPATEVVEFEPKHKKLVASLFDNVYIVEGNEKNIPTDRESVFITLNGKVTQRINTISGGSVGLFEGKKIGRAKNLEKLNAEIKSLQKRNNEIEINQGEKERELDDLLHQTQKKEIEALRNELNLLGNELVSVKTKREQFSDLLNNQTIRKEDILEQVGEIDAELAGLIPQSEHVEKRLAQKHTIIDEQKEAYEAMREVLEEKLNSFNEANILFLQQQNKILGFEKEIEFKNQTLQNSLDRITKNQDELKNNEEEIRKVVGSSEIEEGELLGMYEEKEAIELAVNEAEKEYYANRGHIDELETNTRDLQRKKDNTDTLLMEFQNALNETRLEMSAVRERLKVEFNVNLDQLMIQEEVVFNSGLELTELKETVANTRLKLDKIGPINPMAMEAYNEIKERHDFIHDQRKDLMEAKDSLMETIGEIDQVARDTFVEAFENIKANFIRVFRSLFTEQDDCDLKLIDPDNPLESPIEIMAKPKGKRPLTINQLSGGEKTLTATSLLFSIYLLKPAPFCIFDEVDAPLDDANIDKFNQIIKKFSEESQFIIVTHNKRTMASTDIIYGVTMMEQGVSKVLPVDLRDLK